LVRSSGRPGDDPERLAEAKVETKSGVDMVFFAIAILGKAPQLSRIGWKEMANMKTVRRVSCYWR
jgi:hypothetical protein